MPGHPDTQRVFYCTDLVFRLRRPAHRSSVPASPSQPKLPSDRADPIAAGRFHFSLEVATMPIRTVVLIGVLLLAALPAQAQSLDSCFASDNRYGYAQLSWQYVLGAMQYRIYRND